MADFLIINPDGSIECHRTRLIDESGILDELGTQHVERLTTVEWEEADQCWVARLKSTGKEICRGRVRSEVLKTEAAYVESEAWRNECPQVEH